MNKLQKQFNQLKQVYKDLDLELPTDLKTVQDKLSKEQKTAISGGKGQLVITPAITKDFTFFDLLEKHGKHYVYKELWEKHDFTSPASINVVLMEKGLNDYDEDGLYFTNQTLKEQKESGKGKEFINPIEWLILFMINDGKLDTDTWTRYPQYPKKNVDGFPTGLRSGAFVGAPFFDRSFGNAFRRAGARLSVGQKITLDTQTSSYPYTFSDNIRDYLFNRGHRINKQLIEDIESWLEDRDE
jgi:hypothetical protein